MEKSNKINDEESCVEKDIYVLKARAKEYEKDLNQVMRNPNAQIKEVISENCIYEVQKPC